MYKLFQILILLTLSWASAKAQTPKGLLLDQYQLAKSFLIKDLDNDTYVKFANNAYVLDRYESRKPYFVTGDDGLKKRIDLYTLSARADGATLGTVIYYTNEKGKVYTACLPNMASEGAVWEKYFEDIHATEKEEKDYVLKLSYILSKEFSFQTYKSSLKGKEIDRAESGTYGTNICFPGDGEVLMADGAKKKLSDVEPGDKVMTVDPVTHNAAMVTVKEVVAHDAMNYALTQLTLVRSSEHKTAAGFNVQLSSQSLRATPNHPVMTQSGIKSMGSVKEGEEVICLDQNSRVYKAYTVWNKTEGAGGVQKAYNIEAAGGSTFVIDGVMVMQK